jgi:ketosteroid isomerase-like protein
MNVKTPIALAMILMISAFVIAHSQTAGAPQAKADDVVRLWFERWNALDGSDAATDKLLELYRPDAFHQTSPNDKQLGQVRFEGRTSIRQMIDEFAKANKDITFRIDSATGNEQSVQVINTAELPWKASSAAVQFVGAYTNRKDNRRWMTPGSAFFQIQEGKIVGARFYIPRAETMEVFNR